MITEVQVPLEKIVVIVNGKNVVLDPDFMKFNETTLSDYMEREYGYFDYYGKQLEHAQKELANAEIDAEAEYSKRFIEAKDQGNSDAYSKCFSSAHVDVVAARKKAADRKSVVGQIKAYLLAFQKNHDNAQSRGHFLRKEMDKLNKDIFLKDRSDFCNAEDFIK